MYQFCVAVTFGGTKEIQILINVTNFDPLSRKYVTNDGWKIERKRSESEGKSETLSPDEWWYVFGYEREISVISGTLMKIEWYQ